MKKQILSLTIALLLSAPVAPLWAQKERSEIEEQYKWNVYDLYESEQLGTKARRS